MVYCRNCRQYDDGCVCDAPLLTQCPPDEDAETKQADGSKFASAFANRLLSWGKSGHTIGARMYVSASMRLVAFKFTLGPPLGFMATNDAAEVAKLVDRAEELVSTCEPAKGDLAVFDGKSILLFRTFDERLTVREAKKAADEVASYILWKKELTA